jgi:hypothetical protein
VRFSPNVNVAPDLPTSTDRSSVSSGVESSRGRGMVERSETHHVKWLRAGFLCGGVAVGARGLVLVACYVTIDTGYRGARQTYVCNVLELAVANFIHKRSVGI